MTKTPPRASVTITPDDIEETSRVWQPNYRQLQTAKDALEILINTHNLIGVLFPPKSPWEITMPSTPRRPRRPPQHLRINLVGCGNVSRYLARPLCWYLLKNIEATFEVRVIDGKGEASARLAEEMQRVFPSPVVSAIPEYLVQSNIAGFIGDGDILLICVDNCATVKLISDHAEKLKNVAVIAGNARTDWNDGMVHIHVRRDGKNLTPPLANRYHPELVTPRDRNPGDVPAVERKAAGDEPRSITTCNMVAALMLVLFQRVQTGLFGKGLPENSEFYLDASLGEIVGRARVP
jgi:hypothetical protein